MINFLLKCFLRLFEVKNHTENTIENLKALINNVIFREFFAEFYENHKNNNSSENFSDFMSSRKKNLSFEITKNLSQKILDDIDTRQKYSYKYLPEAYILSEQNHNSDIIKQQEIIEYFKEKLSSQKFIRQLSNKIGLPNDNETKEEFLRRISKIFKEILDEKFNVS